MGDVVVHELSPLHHVVGVQLTGGVHVRHHVDTDQPGGGQTEISRHRVSLSLPDPVTVLGQQDPLEGRVGR